jgi:group I intron endonuclease
MRIYKITNKLNGKQYVGQTKATPEKRFTNHVYAASNGSTAIIHNAIRKYGKDAFEIELLQECQSFEELDEAERRWIAELDTVTPNGYNIEEGGCRNRGSLSEATRAKLREAARHRSPEWYTKICYAARNRSEEWKKKLAASSKGRKPTPRQLECLVAGRQSGVWRHSQVGEDNGNAILTWEKVSQIREMYATGNYSQEQLGLLFGVKQVTVSAIVRYRIWKVNTQTG